MPPRGTLEVRFWKKVDRRGADECWPWLAGRLPHGYGTFYRDRDHHHAYAHRMSYELAFGPIQDGMDVCHRCDNPPCVNPAHLFVGTRIDNVRDMVVKGRGRMGQYPRTARQSGSARWNARLTEADIPLIRARLAAGERYKPIGAAFGVHDRTIADIARGLTWKHVTVEGS